MNNRLDLPHIASDVHTPEQYQPTCWFHVDGQPVAWEGCQTLSGSWGYHRDEPTWNSAAQLVRMLIDAVSKGGNLLMNVVPTARGLFDERALAVLWHCSRWMKLHERSIIGCTQSQYRAPFGACYMQNFETNRLYLQLFDYPFKHIQLPELAGQVAYAQFLHDASEIPHSMAPWLAEEFSKVGQDNCLTLELPVCAPEVVVRVIELFLKN